MAQPAARWCVFHEERPAFAARMVAELKDLIQREGADTIAAFIAEPVIGTGGPRNIQLGLKFSW